MNAERTNPTSHDQTADVGWGTPSEVAAPTTQPVPPRRTGWTAARCALLWTVVAVSLPMVGGGAWMVLEDLSDTTDDWHGFGVALGLMAAVPGLLLAAVAGFGLRSMHRRGADGGRVQAVVLGCLLVLPLMLVTAFGPWAVLPAMLGGLLLTSVYADQGRGA